MKWRKIVYLLRMNEYKQTVELKLTQNIEQWKFVGDMPPEFKEMVELFKYQAELFPEKQSQ